MSEAIKKIEGIDKLFSEIEVNGVTYKTEKTNVAPSVNSLNQSSSLEATDDNSNVSGISLNDIYYEIEDSNARANVKTALLQLISESTLRNDTDTQLQENINAEAQTRSANDNQLQTNINAEAQTRATNDSQLQNSIDTINSKIPSQATKDNQLADKDFVNSSKVPTTRKVNGHALSSDVTVTKSDVGLGNVGNFKAVSTVASQGLTDTEKSNARANIGAGTSSFSGSYKDLTDKPTIPSGQIQSDWNQTNTNAVDYIKNKPTIPSTTGFVPSTRKVNGHALSSDVTVTKSDVGLGNVGNFKAVSTVASQGLTDTEKSNARANIGAGTSSFNGNLNSTVALTSTSNLNLSIASGDANKLKFHRFASSATNAPVKTAGFVITHCMSTTSAVQTAFCGTQIFTRTLSGTTWSAWVAMWSSEDNTAFPS